MAAFADEALVRVADGNAACELGGEAVLLNLDSGTYHGLNPVGTRVWELLQEPRSVGELRRLLLAEYEVEEAQLQEDLASLLASMEQAGLVRIG